MSATNRHGLARQPGDFYETPAAAIDVVLDVLKLDASFSGYVLDVGAGTGAIAQRVAARCPHADVRAIELNEELVEEGKRARISTIAWDAADFLSWEADGIPQLVIGNPPYQKGHFDPTAPRMKSGKPTGEFGVWVVDDVHLAEKFVRRALELVGKKGTVAMLLRENFLVPKRRRALREESGVPDIFALERRPSFNGSGTDACDYAWFVWRPGRRGLWTVLENASG